MEIPYLNRLLEIYNLERLRKSFKFGLEVALPAAVFTGAAALTIPEIREHSVQFYTQILPYITLAMLTATTAGEFLLSPLEEKIKATLNRRDI